MASTASVPPLTVLSLELQRGSRGLKCRCPWASCAVGLVVGLAVGVLANKLTQASESSSHGCRFVAHFLTGGQLGSFQLLEVAKVQARGPALHLQSQPGRQSLLGLPLPSHLLFSLFHSQGLIPYFGPPVTSPL